MRAAWICSQRWFADEVGQQPEFLLAEALQRPGLSATPTCYQYLSYFSPLALYLQPHLTQAGELWSGCAGRHLHILFSIFRWQEKEDAHVQANLRSSCMKCREHPRRRRHRHYRHHNRHRHRHRESLTFEAPLPTSRPIPSVCFPHPRRLARCVPRLFDRHRPPPTPPEHRHRTPPLRSPASTIADLPSLRSVDTIRLSPPTPAQPNTRPLDSQAGSESRATTLLAAGSGITTSRKKWPM